MLKTVVVIAVALAVSSPAFAKAKKAKPAAQPVQASQNENSLKLVKDAFPLFLPTAATIAIVASQKDEKK
jgi:hypothetical protein